MRPKILASEQQVRSLDDWHLLVGRGSGDKPWEPGRSAYECANAWIDRQGRPRVPKELGELLRSRPETAHAGITTVWPERPARRGSLSHEPRRTDIRAIGEGSIGWVALGIDVTADESFGKSVRQVLAAAERRDARGRATSETRSITHLLHSLFGNTPSRGRSLDDIPLQLLTGVAATLSFARDLDAPAAVFVVHEFVTDHTRDEKHLRNLRDFNVLVERLALGRRIGATWGELIGPIDYHGEPLFPDENRPALFIGKIRRVARSPDRLGAFGVDCHDLLVETNGVPRDEVWRSRFDRIVPYAGGSSGTVFLAQNRDGVFVVTSECMFGDLLEPDEPTEFVYRFASEVAREVWCAEQFGRLRRVSAR